MLIDKDEIIEVEQLNFVKNTKEWSIKTETGVKVSTPLIRDLFCKTLQQFLLVAKKFS